MSLEEEDGHGHPSVNWWQSITIIERDSHKTMRKVAEKLNVDRSTLIPN